MFRILRSLGVLSVFLMLLTLGCSTAAPETKPAAAPTAAQSAASKGQSSGPATGEPIKVGYIGALTGGSADMGVPIQKGMEMALEEFNAAGGVNGRPIQLISVDDEANPTKSVTAAQKLVQQDKVVLGIGGPNSTTVQANRQVFSEAGVVELISVSSLDTLIDPKDPSFKTTFRLTEPDRFDVAFLTAYLKSKGYKKIGVVADNTAYGQGGANTLKAAFESNGLQLAAVASHPVGTNDMTPQLLTLKNAGIDAIYLYSLGPDGALFMKTKKESGWDIPIVGARGLNMSAFVNIAKTDADGIIIPSVANFNKPEFKDFQEKYIKKYGQEKSYMFGLLGYDTGRMVGEVLKRSGGKGGDDLVKAFEGLDKFPLTLGQKGAYASFSKDKHESFNDGYAVLLTIKNGEYTLFDENPPKVDIK